METASDYEASEQLVHLLVATVSQGNLLLDIGSTADGRIPTIMQERPLKMGQWRKVNGEAIYSTHPWCQTGDGGVRYTMRDGKVYTITEGWPGSELALLAPVSAVSKHVMLSGFYGLACR